MSEEIPHVEWKSVGSKGLKFQLIIAETLGREPLCTLCLIDGWL